MTVAKMDDADYVIFRLNSKTIKNENNCWLYQGSHDNDGHSTITFKGKSIGIHRFSMFFYKRFDYLDNPSPICHKIECSNPNCWNPEHLYVGSAAENNSDTIRSRKGHLSKTNCPSGHPYDEKNTYIDPQGHRHCRERTRLKMQRRRGNVIG